MVSHATQRLAATAVAVVTLALSSSAATVTFQNGVNGYNGCTDGELRVHDGNYTAKVTAGPTVMLCITG